MSTRSLEDADGQRPTHPAGQAPGARHRSPGTVQAFAAALPALILLACASPEGTSGTAVQRDSAGITIVENGAVEGPVAGWTIDSVPALQLGREDGAGPDVFARIRHAIRLGSGDIAIADAGHREIRIFGSDGSHVRTLGGPGEGPGEFATLWLIGALRDDSIAALDNLGARLSIFSPNGTFARSFTVPRVSGASAPNAIGWLDDGTLVFQALRLPSLDGQQSVSRVLLYTVGGDGRITAEWGDYPDRRVGANGMGLGFGGRAETAVGPRSIWYGNSDRFELSELAPDGTLLRLVRLDRTPTVVTEDETAEARAFVENGLARDGVTGPAVNRILATEYASTFPLHGSLLVDDAGHVWVERYRSNLLDDERAPAWDVFGPDGVLRGRVDLPADLRVMQVGADYILGVHTDALGVERVRLYDLRRTP